MRSRARGRRAAACLLRSPGPVHARAAAPGVPAVERGHPARRGSVGIRWSSAATSTTGGLGRSLRSRAGRSTMPPWCCGDRSAPTTPASPSSVWTASTSMPECGRSTSGRTEAPRARRRRTICRWCCASSPPCRRGSPSPRRSSLSVEIAALGLGRAPEAKHRLEWPAPVGGDASGSRPRRKMSIFREPPAGVEPATTDYEALLHQSACTAHLHVE